MDLKSLRYFVAVAETRSVGKAALRLNMAQPPLSVQIRNLETRLGTALFRRDSDGMQLTEAGRAEAGQVDCGFMIEGEDLDEVKDALRRHFIDAHPSHKIDDAYMLTLADRYRA